MVHQLKELKIVNLSESNPRTRNEMFNLTIEVLSTAGMSLQTLNLHNFGLDKDQA